MNKQDRLVTEDENLDENIREEIDRQGAQTSNKAGLHSDARKPSNAGPDAHEEHKAPVSGAFGGEDKIKREKGA